MMQPMDIKSQSFGTGLFGYKKSDVDQYVDTVYRAYDELFSENKSLHDEKDRLNKAVEEANVKVFELQSKADGVIDTSAAEKERDRIIAEARKAAAEIIANAKEHSDSIAGVDSAEPKNDNSTLKMSGDSDSATSQFFKDASADTVFGDDGDDVFVGEIEDNRKPNKVMIGDGEEEGADDFEFL
ncbi:MAG: DivIVA domain-containing protein [Eubacterium sp.]|nr:DivIVA domain-containing protein [Eubacterium sp.]